MVGHYFYSIRSSIACTFYSVALYGVSETPVIPIFTELPSFTVATPTTANHDADW